MATTVVANAQTPPYQPYAYRPYVDTPAPALPPSWSYDPYTSGLSACPQWTPGDPACRDRLQPTYGQPNYAPVR